MKIKTPVVFTEDHRIVDADGVCLVPDITYKPDLDHVMRQEVIGKGIAEAMNAFPDLWNGGYVGYVSDTFCESNGDDMKKKPKKPKY